MESFIALCTRRFYGEDNQPPKEPRTKSPESLSTRYFDCANFSCVCYANEEEIKKWPTASLNGVYYRFCSPECWSEWAQDPSRIACWSPQIRPEVEDDPIPSFEL